jgi:hypothetical protein
LLAFDNLRAFWVDAFPAIRGSSGGRGGFVSVAVARHPNRSGGRVQAVVGRGGRRL